MTLAVKWIPSPNFTPGRAGHNPTWSKADPNTWIVIHTQDGYQANTIAAFQTTARQASSNYVLSETGAIVQMVKETDAPWTNGTMSGYGSNLDSITIECEDKGQYNSPRTPALYEALAQLLADISRRRGIPLVHRGAGGGVLGHKECQGSSTACPDSLLGDFPKILVRANAILHPPPVPVAPVYTAVMPSGVKIAGPSGVQASVETAAKVWQQANRGVAISVLKDGVQIEQLPAVAPDPPPDTRPEWQKNLKPNAKSFNLAKPVAIIQMSTGVALNTVPVGPLAVAFETTVAGVEFWVTQYGSTAGNGLKKADVAAAIAPVIVPPVDPVVVTPVDPVVSKSLIDLLRQLFEALKKLFGGTTP